MSEKFDLSKVKFNENGLVCVIAQDYSSGDVLMQAYMNLESLKLTLETGYMVYYSRSRQSLWKKGETSGSVQRVISLYADCDYDCILAKVEQTGLACHTGTYSCFSNEIVDIGEIRPLLSIVDELFGVIEDRKLNPKEGSYTNYLFNKGLDKILKKIGEESAETIIAAKNNDMKEVAYEASDLVYHLLVLLSQMGMKPADIARELAARR